jgi:hypothetical protein
MIEPNKNSYNNPIQYTKTPLISGYISKEKLALLKKQFLFHKKEMETLYLNNTNFRAFWLGQKSYCGMLFS